MMKMSLRKIFDIVIASLALLLFIFMFIPYFGSGKATISMWKYSNAVSVFMLLNLLGIIAVYLLHLFGVLKDKWVNYAHYAIGAVAFWNVAYLFDFMEYTKVGVWLGTIVSLGMLTVSVLWHLLAKGEKSSGGKKITGYDPKTGKPIYAEPKGYDPKTGKPIYE